MRPARPAGSSQREPDHPDERLSVENIRDREAAGHREDPHLCGTETARERLVAFRSVWAPNLNFWNRTHHAFRVLAVGGVILSRTLGRQRLRRRFREPGRAFHLKCECGRFQVKSGPLGTDTCG